VGEGSGSGLGTPGISGSSSATTECVVSASISTSIRRRNLGFLRRFFITINIVSFLIFSLYFSQQVYLNLYMLDLGELFIEQIQKIDVVIQVLGTVVHLL